MLHSKSRSGYLEFGHKKHSSFLPKSISRSKFCRGDGLASQVDKEALVSVDRNSVSLSENRIVKAAMMQKQLNKLEEELKNTKERLDEAESERDRVIAELQDVKELNKAGLSPKRAEQVFSELKSLEDSLSNSKKEIESRDNEISLLRNRVESAKVFEVKLSEREGSLEELKKRVLDLEDQVEKGKQAESNMLESLMLQTRQFEETKMDLEESKLEVDTLNAKLSNLQKGNLNSSLEFKTLKDEIAMLKTEVKLATEAEEKSKKAMDDLASALREVATEATTAKEKLKSSEEQVTHLKDEIKQLNQKLELQTNTSERLRVEAEESILAWTAKEMGFISCIKRADEENASLKQENNKLKEALAAAENTIRITREEAFKLRDILKQALNESSVAKEASNIARAENSELKDLLAEKEETLRVLTKENERSRITEVAVHENLMEFKSLLAEEAEANKPCEDKEQPDVFNSPVSSPYEDHLDGRTTAQQMFSFDFDYMKVLNKEDDTMFGKKDDPIEVVVDDDPEKAEALTGSSSDSNASPRSEPQMPKSKAQHRRDATGCTDSDGSGQFEEVDSNVNENSSGNHTEDSEDQGYYMYRLYNRKKLFRKIGELIGGVTNSEKERLIDHGKEQGREQIQEQVN